MSDTTKHSFEQTKPHTFFPFKKVTFFGQRQSFSVLAKKGSFFEGNICDFVGLTLGH